MKTLLIAAGLAAAVLTSGSELAAHGPDPEHASARGMIVTRHFTGIWDQVDHEAQGIALQVVEQLDDSRKAVAYWYTYGADRNSAWYMGIGDLVDNRIELDLFESSGVGFLQASQAGNASVHPIGSMTIEFDSCTAGTVRYDTQHADVGSGSELLLFEK